MAEAKKKTTPKKSVSKKTTKTAAAKKTKTAVTKKVATKKPTTAKKAAVKKTTKTVSKKPQVTKKKQESKAWKMTAIVLTALAIILLLVIGYYSMSSEDNNQNGNIVGIKEEVSENSIVLTIVEDPSCATCQVDLFAAQVKQNLIPNLVVEKHDASSEKGKELIEKLGANYLPLYLFDEKIAQRDDWATNLQGAFVKTENSYLLNPQFVPAKVLAEEPKITENAIILGNPDAEVTVIEFSDFECPFCAIAKGNEELVEQFRAQQPTYTPSMPDVFKKYIDTGKIRFVFYNMPLEAIHPKARDAHNAALCAHDQDMWKEYSNKLFLERESWISGANPSEYYNSLAKELSLDTAKFETCLSEKPFDSQIDEEIKLAQQYDIAGTPAFFIGKHFLSGAQDFTIFETLIEAELNK